MGEVLQEIEAGAGAQPRAGVERDAGRERWRVREVQTEAGTDGGGRAGRRWQAPGERRQAHRQGTEGARAEGGGARAECRGGGGAACRAGLRKARKRCAGRCAEGAGCGHGGMQVGSKTRETDAVTRFGAAAVAVVAAVTTAAV